MYLWNLALATISLGGERASKQCTALFSCAITLLGLASHLHVVSCSTVFGPSSHCCWLLAVAGCRQQWLRPRSSPNGACGEWRTRAVRAPPGSRVPQTHAAPEKRFSCYTHKPRGGRQGRCHLSLALKIGEWLGTERVLRSVAEC